MLEIINLGGWVMYMILGCSVVALGFMIERFLTFYYAKCNMQQFYPGLENLIKSNKIPEAIEYCGHFSGLIPKLLLAGLKNKDESPEELRQILVEEIQIHVLPILQKNFHILATIAKAAPMLGLLGTVLGMFTMFQNIGKFGLGDPQKLSGDIGYALITTVGGLMVTIPILIIHAYFQGQIRKFELDIFHYLTRFLRAMRRRKESPNA